jgi:hypothetical protein
MLPSIAAGATALEPPEHVSIQAARQEPRPVPGKTPVPRAQTHAHPHGVVQPHPSAVHLGVSPCEQVLFKGGFVLKESGRVWVAGGYFCFSERLFKKQNAVARWV